MASVAEPIVLGNMSDITKDLPTLQFENALSEDEKLPYLILRKRSHAITVSACAQATYFVAILNEARQKILELKSPQQSKTSKFLQKAPPRDPLKIGIVGCGRIGSHLTNTLLTYGDVLPQDLLISTRRPETLTQFKKKGIECVYDNVRVASSVDLLFLCVLPSQLGTVSEDLRGAVPPHCTIYTFLSSVPMARLHRTLDVGSIVRPVFIWDQRGGAEAEAAAEGEGWDCTKDVCITLENPAQVAVTCPLAGLKSSIVQTKEKWAELILYSFINMCTRAGLEKEQAIAVANAIILGQLPNKEYPTAFRAYDFTRRPTLFPVFDLAAVATNQTPLTQTVTENEQLRALFTKKYLSIFDKFYYWKGIKQVKPKNQNQENT